MYQCSVLRNLLATKDSIGFVCFSPDGKHLATSSLDGRIYIWEIAKRFVRKAFTAGSSFWPPFDFSPNGRLLVANADNGLFLWNLRDGSSTLLTEEDLLFSYCSPVFSPDGRYIAASDSDGFVQIWDARVGQLMRRVKAHATTAYDVAFMPDGKGLITGAYDGNMRYWDLSSLCSRFRSRSQMTGDLHGHVPGMEEQSQPEREFLGHESIICSVVISPDGRWAVSGSWDNSVRIWDTTNAAMQCILNHDQPVLTVDVSPVGCYIASGGRSGTVGIWRYSYNTVGGH